MELMQAEECPVFKHSVASAASLKALKDDIQLRETKGKGAYDSFVRPIPNLQVFVLGSGAKFGRYRKTT
jgi:hypothetical protein